MQKFLYLHHSNSKLGTSLLGLSMIIGCSSLSNIGLAEIVVKQNSGQALSLSGPNYNIAAELGSQQGNNLFHEFSQFSLKANEIANFNGPGSIENIISRVSSDSISHINGEINSLIPKANFWFINPNGIIFGDKGTINADGNIYVSSADYLSFKDGQRLYSRPHSQSSLSTAAPETFGFIDSSTAIAIQNAQLLSNKNISLSAAHIYGEGEVHSPSGSVQLIAIKHGDFTPNGSSPSISSQARLGNIELGQTYGSNSNPNSNPSSNHSSNQKNSQDSESSPNQDLPENTLGFAIYGSNGIYLLAQQINLNNVSINSFSHSKNNGKLSLQAKDIQLLNTQIASISSAQGSGNDIEISANKSLKIMSSHSPSAPFSSNMNAEIFAGHQSEGRAGNIIVQSPEILIDNGRIVNQPFIQQNNQNTISSGHSGAIIINSHNLTLKNGGLISTFNYENAKGGNIHIRATNKLLIEDLSRQQQSSITAGTSSSGSAGKIFIDAKKLHINGGAIFAESTQAFEQQINFSQAVEVGLPTFSNDLNTYIDTDTHLTQPHQLFLRNQVDTTSAAAHSIEGPEIGIIDLPFSDIPGIEDSSIGNAGDIAINAEQIKIHAGGQLATKTYTSGHAGSITINATQSLELLGGQDSNTGIYAGTEGTGNGGILHISAENISLSQADIRSDSGRNAIQAPESLGHAGGINIKSKRLSIKPSGVISSTSYGNGNGGQINIIATQELAMLGQKNTIIQPLPVPIDAIAIDAEADASTNPSSALANDNIEPNAYIVNDTGIEAINHGNGNRASQIRIQAGSLNMDNHASINSKATNFGPAGSIHINLSKDLILTGKADISTEAYTQGGEVRINSNDNVYIQDSRISAASSGDGAQDNSGNVFFQGSKIMVLDNAKIEAKALAGNGGNIELKTKRLLKNTATSLDASSELGVPGEVAIDSVASDTSSLNHPPKLILAKPAKLLEDQCSQRRNARQGQAKQNQDSHSQSQTQYSSLILESARSQVVMRKGQLVYQDSTANTCQN